MNYVQVKNSTTKYSLATNVDAAAATAAIASCIFTVQLLASVTAALKL
jgi:hypothetical protein